jgi:hypothetical protein
MAALDPSAVALYPGITPSATVSRPSEWPVGQKGSDIITRSLVITSLAQGDATDTIGASALGFTTLLSCGTLWDATNSKGYPTVINPITNIILLLDGQPAPTPVKVTTTTAYITVTGSKKAASAT